MQLVADGVEMWDPMKQKDDRARRGDRAASASARSCSATSWRWPATLPTTCRACPGSASRRAAQLLQEYGSLDELLANAREHQAAQAARDLLAGECREGAPVAYAGLPRARRHRCRCGSRSCRPPADYDAPACRLSARANGFRSLARRVEPPVAAVRRQPPRAGAAPAEASSACPTIAILARSRRRLLERATAAGIARTRHARPPSLEPRARRAGRHLPRGRRPAKASICRSAHRRRVRPALAPASSTGPRCSSACARCSIDPSVLKIGHNIKYDQGVLARYGLDDPAPVDDTMLMSYVLRRRQPRSRPGRAGPALPRPRRASPTRRSAARGGADRLRRGAGREGHGLRRRGRRGHAAPVAGAASRGCSSRAMARASTRPSTGRWCRCSPRWSATASRSTRTACASSRPSSPSAWPSSRSEAYKLAGRRFNLGSPKQLGEVLFDELDLGGRRARPRPAPRHRRRGAGGAGRRRPRAAAR